MYEILYRKCIVILRQLLIKKCFTFILGTGEEDRLFKFRAAKDADISLLSSYTERDLIKQLALLPKEIRIAARDYNPARVNAYVTELAARFHKFYTVCRIRDAEKELLEARLLLADCVRRVIAISLSVIGVSAPEKM